MIELISESFRDLAHNIWSFVAGIVSAIFGYFLPIQDIVHQLILFFVLDVVFGYLAAKKLRGERFSARIIWNTTIPRMLIALVLILGSYVWDEVYQQEFVSTYKIIGWFISGVLFFSIIQNAYKVTNWEMLPLIGRFISQKLDDKTGINIQKEADDDHE
ncbi:phage holin family protein [Sunxiuqinia sp. sy24]|uniref:phage holin family protein n=1 Tax=Sunxiuqinia sp. sy24 TaxID=3461495 RepID=UPI00404643DB